MLTISVSERAESEDAIIPEVVEEVVCAVVSEHVKQEEEIRGGIMRDVLDINSTHG